MIRQGFPLANVDHAQPAEIAVLGTERTVDDGHVFDQLWTEGFQSADVALAVTLGALVLLDVVEHDFETAVDAAMIEIETKATEFERFAAAFVLAGMMPALSCWNI